MLDQQTSPLPPSPEEDPSSAYGFVASLTTPEARDTFIESLQQQIQADPELAACFAANDQLSLATQEHNKALREGQSTFQMREELRQAQNAANEFPEEVRQQYRTLQERLDAASELGALVTDDTSDTGHKLLDMLHSAPRIQEDHTAEAPFRDYKQNTTEVWKHVPKEEVQAYIDRRLRESTDLVKTEPGSVAVVATDQPIEVPTDLIVHTAGGGGMKEFESPYGTGEMTSPNLAKHYANLETDLPPVGIINVYVQEDGKMFADNGNGDSHRIRAAVLRGQPTILADKVVFKRPTKPLV